jgi:hypothetical protein
MVPVSYLARRGDIYLIEGARARVGIKDCSVNTAVSALANSTLFFDSLRGQIVQWEP